MTVRVSVPVPAVPAICVKDTRHRWAVVEFRELLNVPPLTNLRVGWCKVQHQQEHLSIAWISKVTDSPSNLELEKTSSLL